MNNSIYWNVVETAHEAYLKARAIEQLDDYDVETFDDTQEQKSILSGSPKSPNQIDQTQQEFIKTILNSLYVSFGFENVKVLQDDVVEWKTPFESFKKEKEELEVQDKDIQSSVIDLFNDLKLEIKCKLQDTQDALDHIYRDISGMDMTDMLSAKDADLPLNQEFEKFIQTINLKVNQVLDVDLLKFKAKITSMFQEELQSARPSLPSVDIQVPQQLQLNDYYRYSQTIVINSISAKNQKLIFSQFPKEASLQNLAKKATQKL